MNKIPSADNDDISRTLYNFAKSIENSKKLQDQIWETFRMSDKNDLTPKKAKFSSHPERLSSDSDVSVNNKKINFLKPKEIFDCHSRLKKDSHFRATLLTDETKSFMEKHSKFKVKNNIGKESSNNVVNSAKDVNDSCKISTSLLKKQILKNLNAKSVQKTVYFEENEAISTERKKSQTESNTKNVAQTQNRANVYCIENFEDLKKMNTFLTKSIDSLDLIKNLMDRGVEPPDGDEDYLRRKKRCIEFSSRFSRNYLYQLDRLIAELTLKRKPSPNKNPTQKASIALKILSSQHLMLQALTAYHSHMPSSVKCGIPSKLRELLERAIRINDIHIKHLKSEEYKDVLGHVQEFQNKSKSLMYALDRSKVGVKENGVHSKLRVNRGSVNGFKPPKVTDSSDVPFHVQNSLDSRLSVYGTSSSVNYRKSIATLARKHNFAHSVKSRYKTATLKHRPLQEKDGVSESSSKRCFPPERVISMTRSISSPIPSPINEDSIPTMVQLDEHSDVDATRNGSESAAGYTEIIPLAKELCTMICRMNQNKVMSQEELETAIRNVMHTTISSIRPTSGVGADNPSSIQGGQSRVPSTEVLANAENERLRAGDKVASSHKFQNQCYNHHQQQFSASEEIISGRKLKKKDSVTVIGPKNVQLICINADPNREVSFREEARNSNYEYPQMHKLSVQNFTVSESEPENVTLCKHGSPHQTLHPILKVSSSKDCTTSVTRLPKKSTKKLLSLLPRKTVLNIAEYQIKFRDFTKDDPMYSTTNHIKPWHILDSISDKLLDDLLRTLSTEINVANILDKIFVSEFQ